MLRPGKRGVALESKGRQAAKVRKVSWKAEVSDDGSASVASDEVMDPGTPLSDSDDEQEAAQTRQVSEPARRKGLNEIVAGYGGGHVGHMTAGNGLFYARVTLESGGELTAPLLETDVGDHNAAAWADFAPCDHFDGARPGYVFRTGSRGTGYYRNGFVDDKKQSEVEIGLMHLTDAVRKLDEIEASLAELREMLYSREKVEAAQTSLDALDKLVARFEALKQEENDADDDEEEDEGLEEEDVVAVASWQIERCKMLRRQAEKAL
mmetsp:Transcript_20167/g.44849  ORF Transcript_20167/g.44849 Transcript_20167/m.44849 type:complete len:265 (-) Transcript_20167:56-850(-)